MPDRTKRRSAAAAAVYAGLLFGVYLGTGPVRATTLDPLLGGTAGAAVEAAAFMPVTAIGGAALPKLFGITRNPVALGTTGLLALMLFLLGDAIVAVTLCGLTVAEHLARFATAPGWIQGAALVFFAAFPWLWWRADMPRAAASTA